MVGQIKSQEECGVKDRAHQREKSSTKRASNHLVVILLKWDRAASTGINLYSINPPHRVTRRKSTWGSKHLVGVFPIFIEEEWEKWVQ